MKTVVHVVGARPNYMKIAPLMEAMKNVAGVRQLLVNTGQHYDDAMSKAFLRELGLPKPDRDLEVGSASHAVQTAKVMIGFEQVCLQDRPDLFVVVGDVNSTMAATLVAAKLMIPVAHLEAGLRSFDPAMPEEINRVVTDRLADLLLTPSADGDENLLRIDLRTWKTRTVHIGWGPRALAFEPQGRYIYASLNDEGRVVRRDLWTGRETSTTTGSRPRSLAISADGTALYVVNYDSGTLSKIRTRDMQVVQDISACEHPIGVTYDAAMARVWTACYGGQILVFNDR